MAKKKKTPPPVQGRNPHIQNALFRRAGSHQKSRKSERRDAKLALKREALSVRQAA